MKTKWNKLIQVLKTFEIPYEEPNDSFDEVWMFVYPQNRSRVAVVASICIQQGLDFEVSFDEDGDPEVIVK